MQPLSLLVAEGSLEVKRPTIWTDEKAEVGRVREEKEERRSEKRKSQRKKMQAREKIENSQNAVFFQWFVAPKGREVGSLTLRVQSDLVKWRSEITCRLGAKQISKSRY